MFTKPNLDRLTQPIGASRVKSRSGGRGGTLSYIEAHDAIRTANEIFGIGGWFYTVEELTPLGEPEPVTKDNRKGFRAGYRAVVKVTIPGVPPAMNQAGGLASQRPTVTFSDVGYGDSIEYTGSYITVQELAMKEAVSDGVKRALKNLGDQFGLSLYDKEARAEIEARAKLASSPVTTLKKRVWTIAKDELGKETPTAKQVAAHFKVDAADLAERDVLLKILTDRGLV
jgi:DNA repair and recombination protein RAD52